MGRWEHRYLGWDRFPDPSTPLEIEHLFTLEADELACAKARRTPSHRLAVALHIVFLKTTGRLLNSVEIVPVSVLEHLGRQLGCTPPRITSIRALYRRRRTLFDHQEVALDVLGLDTLGGHAERGLVAYLRREAMSAFDPGELLARARSWLADHRHVLPHERRLRHLVARARRHRQCGLLKAIGAAVGAATMRSWADRLTALHEPSGVAYLEWLRAGPPGKSARGLEEQIAKVQLLKELGAAGLTLPDLPLTGLEHFARPMMTRKPAALARLTERRRTLEIACFLRRQLLRLSDAGIELLDHRIADLWRGARDRAEASEAGQLRRYRRMVADLCRLLDDEQLSAAELRLGLRTVIAQATPATMPTRVATIRQELGRQGKDLAGLLELARAIDLDIPGDHPLATAFMVLDRVAASASATLPADAIQPFGATWQSLIEQEDRAAALGCYRAATVLALKRALRNGSISVDHSIAYRQREERLIPRALWERERARVVRDLGLPRSGEAFLQRLEATLTAGLEAVAEAVADGAMTIDEGTIVLPKAKPAPEDPRLDRARRALVRATGETQLPAVLIEIDGLTRFSWILLGRPPRSERELVTLYAGIIALGADLSAADLVRMVPSLGADSVGLMTLRLQTETRLRAASDAVLAFLRSHPIAELWGGGLFASADMMSLEATRYLWAARLDPRRRTYAVGTYTHVLDQWGILYDQPIVLNRRQAGAAIEGALRQQHVPDLERVAVDTHGFTHFAMALAKLVGFDLCPRLARLKTRKLYLTRGMAVPAALQPIVAETVSRRAISRAWDGLLRLASSVREGWCPATEALERFGAAARGDPVHTAGEALGKLLRTVYLCDYLGNPSFRREILDLLNQGEAVHSLQRAIQQGPIGAKRGRTIEQLAAISGALTLLANVIMAWNTHRMQAIVGRSPADYPDELIAHVAPTTHQHINMRGIFTFDLGRHRPRLLGPRPIHPARARTA